jgi:hypothetical protein
MFNSDFYPTPENVILQMLEGYDITGKTVLEPSAGKGNIVDFLKNGGASVIACEKNEDLRKILNTKCQVIGDDFLKVESHQVSHIDLIVMNPPFSADEKHILHAWNIAPAGCQIIALANLRTLENRHSKDRERLGGIIEENGSYIDLGDCFTEAERKTGVEVALIKIQKPGSNYNQEFEGFFMDDDPEETQENSIMPYNVVRDLVNRYVEAIKIFDKQIKQAVKMEAVLSDYFSHDIALTLTQDGAPQTRNEFKKSLQKSGWKYIFSKMNMQKYATKGLREDINKFVEKQVNIPFTMKNIYKMLEMVVGTQESRMDRAIVEVFDKLTEHYHENRYNVEGWKTNSHYLINEKFIINGMCATDKWNNDSIKVQTSYGKNFERIEDMMKAMCFITGDNYDNFVELDKQIRYRYKVYSNGKYIDCAQDENSYSSGLESIKKKLYDAGRPVEVVDLEPLYGQWFDWGYFEVKAFKKGTMHFKFKSPELWAKFNQRVAKIKGYVLPESVKKTEKKPENQETRQPVKVKILATIRV